MMVCSPVHLDPRTRLAVCRSSAQGRCGCVVWGRRWSVCEFHSGFEAALRRYPVRDASPPVQPVDGRALLEMLTP